MEIQINKGILDTRSSLVLHVDLEKRPSGTSSHVAKVYEAATEVAQHNWPEIFHSTGS